jgi:hypothetical protein
MKKSNIRIFTVSITLIIILFALMVTAQGLNLKNYKSNLKTTESKPWTTLYYIDNDYANPGYDDPIEQLLIDEISSNENINVVIIQDTIDGPAFLYYIDEDHNKILLEELGEMNMGDYQTLSYFIDYGKHNYPADRYLLWVYNHGGGWKGACMDDTNNDPLLTMDDFQNALTETGGVDIISFFACLMSSLESVYELRDLVDVYVGSEDLAHTVWWDGICGDTNQLLTYNPGLSNDEIGTQIVEFYQTQSNPMSHVLTASAIKAGKTEPLVNALDALAQYFIDHWIQCRSDVKAAHENTFLLANFQGWAEVFEVYDLKGFIENLPDSTEKTAVLDAFEQALIHEVHGRSREETHGLSIFFPQEKGTYDLLNTYRDEELSLDFPNDTCWDEFLLNFTTKSKSIEQSRIFHLNIIKTLVQGLYIKIC